MASGHLRGPSTRNRRLTVGSGRLIAGSAVCALLAGGLVPANLPGGGPIAPAGAIIGGAPVVGDRSVVAIEILGRPSCSGVVYAPRIVVTAAHCTTPDRGRSPRAASSFRVYPPGVDTRTSTPVNVRQVIQSPRFFNATSGTLQQVLDYMAFDVAFLVLESDLAAPEVAGILTADQVKSLVDSAVPVTALGYGCTVSRGGMSTVPKAVAMPLRGVYQRDGVWVLEYRRTSAESTCPGDSGGPTLATIDGRRYLVSVLTGGYTATGWQDVSLGPVVSAHPTLLAQATAAALVPAIQAVPVISPAAGVTVGGVLSATSGVWQHLPSGYAYQWQRCASSAGTGCTAIPGATGSTYTVTSSDSGTAIRVDVVATNQNGTSNAASSTAVMVGSGTGAVPGAGAGVATGAPSRVCIEGPDVTRACAKGGRWTYAYCWDSPRARLERFNNGGWVSVASIRGTRDSGCRQAYPFSITVSRTEQQVGRHRYRILVNNTADPFTATATGVTAAAPSGSAAPAPTAAPTPLTCAQGGACAVGDRGPGGGVVFYDAGAAQPWGRYLEVAPSGWAGAADPDRPWCSRDAAGFGVRVPTATGLGAGRGNTAAALALCGAASAAGTAAGYQGGGRSDWHLPSRDEVTALLQQRTVTGLVGLLTGGYWTSTQGETDIGLAWLQAFDGDARLREKHLNGRVRPIRAF